MYGVVVDALTEEKKQYWSPMSRYPAGTLNHAAEVLGVFVDCLKKLRALAERRADGTRTFKLIEGGPLQTSYGEDLYRQVFEPEMRSAAEDRRLSAAE